MESGEFSILRGAEEATADPALHGLPGPSANTSVILSSLHRVFLGRREQIHSFHVSAGSTSQISSASLGCGAATALPKSKH